MKNVRYLPMKGSGFIYYLFVFPFVVIINLSILFFAGIWFGGKWIFREGKKLWVSGSRGKGSELQLMKNVRYLPMKGSGYIYYLLVFPFVAIINLSIFFFAGIWFGGKWIFRKSKKLVSVHFLPPLTPPKAGGEPAPPPFFGRVGGGTERLQKLWVSGNRGKGIVIVSSIIFFCFSYIVLSLAIVSDDVSLTPTPDADAIATIAFQTVIAEYTQTALAIPTETFTPTLTLTPTLTPQPTFTPPPTLTFTPLPTRTPVPTPDCVCGYDYYNCSDAKAEVCFAFCMPISGDVHGLDRDGDGHGCEWD